MGYSGYAFQNWTGDYSGTDNPLIINNVTSDISVKANFVYTGSSSSSSSSRGGGGGSSATYLIEITFIDSPDILTKISLSSVYRLIFGLFTLLIDFKKRKKIINYFSYQNSDDKAGKKPAFFYAWTI